MKKTSLSLFVSLCCLGLVAQDKLIERNADTTAVDIIEVSTNLVKFTMAGDPDGPKNTMKLGYIHKIIYENGSEKVYSPMYRDANRNYTKRRQTGLSVVLSVVLPGSGQIYNKDYGKGAIMGGAYIGAGIATLICNYYYHYYYDQANLVEWWNDPDDLEDQYRDKSYSFESARNVSLLGMGAVWLWAVIDAPIRASIINQRYNLADGTIFENDDIGIQFKPYLTTHSLYPGFDFNTAFPVFGAKMTLTLK